MIRKIFSHRATRLLCWFLVTLLTFLVLLFVWTNWSGKRRWVETKAMIEKEGETLDFRALLPPAPPESENLLAIGPLQGLADVVDGDTSKGEPGAKRAALAAMKWQGAMPSGSGVTVGKASEMQEWQKFLSESKFLDLPASSATPGRDVLAALDAKFPLLKQISDEAPRRHQAMFTPALIERELPDMLFTLSMAHYNGAQSLARLLTLRARAAMDAKNGSEAANSLVATLRIAHACEQEPLLIGLLVGITLEAQASEALWLGLRDRVFTEAELRSLQQLYAGNDTARFLLHAMRGELAAGMDTLEYMQDMAAGRKPVEKSLGAEMTGLNSSAYSLLPSGLFDHWKSVMGEIEVKHLILPLKQGIPAAVRAAATFEEEMKDKSNLIRYPDWVMVRLMVPAMKQVSLNAWQTAARNRQALIAIALERFFASKGHYPGKLEELTPEFLPSVPADPCDDQPMRYRMTPGGRFSVWSVGLDRKDDAGRVTVDAKGSAKLNKSDYLGDWTWQYEPVK